MNTRTFKLTFFAVTLLLFTTFASSQASGEGFDLMLQITHQFAHPNLAIVMDVTGSMASDAATETNVGVDSTGYPYWKYDAAYGKTSWPGYYGAWPGGTAKYVHVYWLVGGRPSRMAIVKNALGSSVALFDWTEPSTWPTITGWTRGTNTIDGIPWYWKTSNSSGAPATPSTLTIPTGCPSAIPACPVGTITKVYCPKNLIGQTKSTVNWGLIVYSASYGDCNEATVQTTFDLAESGDDTALQNAFKLKLNGGLDCGGYTNTRAAMKQAKEYLTKSATGGTIYDYDNSNHSVDRDDKFFLCNRTVGAVLITDGLSNACNESDVLTTRKNWINPCGAAPYDCDATAGTYDCDRRSGVNRSYTKYPAGRIDELWNATVVDGTTTYRLNARTWVIGVSNAVNPCELNYNAYMGRTDASAPKGDAGFNTGADLARLPSMNTVTDPTTGLVTYTTCKDNEESVSHYNDNDPRTTGKNYAYFATNADALNEAFMDIVAGVATGDYTTSAPVGTPSTAGGGYNAYLATADFPDWRGHLYCYDTNAEPAILRYDMGYQLTSLASSYRKIYTWNSSNDLVEVNASNLSQLQSIAVAYTPSFDPAKLTTAVVDFIKGNDGTGVSRAWKLGPIMNSTPTIIGRPEYYKQGTVDPTHLEFQTTFATRKPLLYAGSDDGMLHCFLITDETSTDAALTAGRELFAILPPNLLATQATLYQNYLDSGIVTGQAKRTNNHIYGVANSPRYGDVFFPSEGKWRTVLFLTEGPGGNLVAALDVTDPFTRSTTSTGGGPVDVLWHFTSQTCPELKNSWSVPAIGAISSTGFTGIIGTGYDTLSSITNPYLLVFDPVDGSMVKKPISPASSGYMRNQAFANSVIFKTESNGFYSDNLVDLGVQADLHGRLWFYKVADGSLTNAIDVSPAPIYYPPAVSGYKKGANTYTLYAFATGTYYEKDVDITGSTASFVPRLYIAGGTPWGTDTTALNITSMEIQDLSYSYTMPNGNTGTATLGPRSQVTTSPVLIVPTDTTTDPQAVFAVYDPDTDDCAGTSYIVVMKIVFSSTGAPGIDQVAATSAGSGAISGFTIVGGKVVVAKSGVGAGKKATLSKVPGLTITNTGGPPRPNWWRELQ